MAGERHFLDMEKTGGNQDINILLDSASIAMQAKGDSRDGRGGDLGGTKEFESGRGHDRKHIPWVFEGQSDLHFQNFAGSVVVSKMVKLDGVVFFISDRLIN